MIFKNPARVLVVVRHDRRAAGESLDIYVTKRLPDCHVQEYIGTSVKYWHEFVWKSGPQETTGQQISREAVNFFPQRTIPGHDEKHTGHRRDGSHSLKYSLAIFERTYHKNYRTTLR